MWIIMIFIQDKLIEMYNKFCKSYREIIEINYSEAIEIAKNNPDVIFLDVRSEQEYKENHINNSINIPLYQLEQKAENMLKDKNKIIIAYCHSGKRSKKAVKILKNLRYSNIYNLKGGIEQV